MQLFTKQCLPVSLIYNLLFLHGISETVISHFGCMSRTGQILCFCQEHMRGRWPCRQSLVSACTEWRRGAGPSHLHRQGRGDGQTGRGPRPRAWGIASETLAPATETTLKAVGSICPAFSLPFIHCMRWKPCGMWGHSH